MGCVIQKRSTFFRALCTIPWLIETIYQQTSELKNLCKHHGLQDWLTIQKIFNGGKCSACCEVKVETTSQSFYAWHLSRHSPQTVAIFRLENHDSGFHKQKQFWFMWCVMIIRWRFMNRFFAAILNEAFRSPDHKTFF